MSLHAYHVSGRAVVGMVEKTRKNLLVRLHFIVTDCNFQSNEAFA